MAYGLIAAGLGANLIGSLFNVGSERRRLKELRRQQLANLGPMEALLQQENFGPSQTEGYLTQSVTQRTLGDLAQRGVLQSSVAAPSVAAAVAPIEAQHQARRQSLLERLTAARQAIYQNTQLPGYGDAFGQALGQGGETLALLGGQELGDQRIDERYGKIRQMMQGDNADALGSGGIGGGLGGASR